MTKHPFTADPELAADIQGNQVCTCGLFERNRVHALPERTDEERAVEARRIGEA